MARLLVESLRAGKLVEIVEEPTLADALAGGLGAEHEYSFDMIQANVAETNLVSEEEISAAMAFAPEEYHLVVEGVALSGLRLSCPTKLESWERTSPLLSVAAM